MVAAEAAAGASANSTTARAEASVVRMMKPLAILCNALAR